MSSLIFKKKILSSIFIGKTISISLYSHLPVSPLLLYKGRRMICNLERYSCMKKGLTWEFRVKAVLCCLVCERDVSHWAIWPPKHVCPIN